MDISRTPAVIANNVDVSYQVLGAGSQSRDETVTGVLSRAKNRAKSQVGTRTIHAVKDVSFTAYKGEAVGLIGRNGSGKSTLLRSVAGLIPPTGGSIYLNGTASLLGVNAALMKNLSGARNIMIGGQALGLTRREVREKFDEIVEFADIGDFINLPMSSYSSGMAARLRFAISTVKVPDILVVDEALATGDAEFKARASARIEEIREGAGTIFLVSHSASQIKSMCTRGLWLDKGHLIMDGPAEEVASAYAKKYPVKKRPAKKAAPAKRLPRPWTTHRSFLKHHKNAPAESMTQPEHFAVGVVFR
ncbi:ABC transporter ATP-binding protein [Ornithinimicrobium sp. INDO-MA30-4]|uniref:ABC transporter ATP-binding protein n=1 Tax=Ornithinimicrobium sp. INDO-MA30-4 TaxID=2908651 RepID=UPI001F3ED2C8|nr:ABC transporter ATP-binding protein [Ornithinimicrobium sp. INDO-MA30-4]UJH70098.1 ABC transporter ATP-binding protein [Ornithinimicrobium sp. INDO-MA30-4]